MDRTPPIRSGTVWGSRGHSGCLSVVALVVMCALALMVGVARADTRTVAMGPHHPTARLTVCAETSGVAGVIVTAASHEPFTLKVARLSGNRYVTVGTLRHVGDSTAIANVNANTCVAVKLRNVGPAITYTLKDGVT